MTVSVFVTQKGKQSGFQNQNVCSVLPPILWHLMPILWHFTQFHFLFDDI